MKPLLLFLFLTALCRAEPHLPAGTKALPSAAANGRGPLALVNLNHHVLGHARVFDGKEPDLFVAGYGGPQAVHLFRWVDTAEAGAPVFAQPVEVKCAFKDKGSVFQRKDGAIVGLWIDKDELVTTEFDREKLEFRETKREKLAKAVKSPGSLGVLVNDDGSYDAAFEMSNGGKGAEGSPNTEEWRPFNSSGIAVGELRYRYLMGVSAKGEAKQITKTKNEVYFSMHGITGVNLGAGHERDLVTGSRQGNLVYYHNKVASGFDLEAKRLIAGEDGNALRHPSNNPSVCAYGGGLIACGEGSLYFYRFTGKFTKLGAPVCKEPVSVLQEHADLYAGTLPTPTTVDWDGDGALDILAGNSEGFVLFFKNIGSNEEPKFLPAIRVQAGGREIQVQAGYAGSLQGLQEARWGYLSPNVIDWNGDALPDIITGDITGNYLIYLNRGTKTEPKLDPAHPIYCDGIDLHGMWRCRPALARIGERVALAIVDGDDHFHLYWRIDDYNVWDGGKLLLDDGGRIGASGGVGGMSGRCKLDFFDWNQDGKLDFVLGTGRVCSIPDRITGYPMAALGQNPVVGGLIGKLVDSALPTKLKKTLGTPLVMLNTGTNTKMRFERPLTFQDEEGQVIQPGGAHETGAVGTMLGGSGPNLLICNEAGRMFLLPGKKLQTKP
ncbi:MAG: VCBS repeat-containing protein [Prosthecobacter sp.]|uniref:FG-GAP repeat domain-containing protein n=1 Tax=Prosthecobacter sp. TaxID=1965333 RepID=UPI0025E954A7|nr:VCBS repeat-containing protein [Prosthecobacter sp.]MCF7784525.1 VCBS repeat-containing protein [Prosthecobacter sp.]